MLLTRLEEIRKNKGLAFEDVAKLSGVSHQTIRNAEKGRGVILNNARAIAKALRVPLEELL